MKRILAIAVMVLGLCNGVAAPDKIITLKVTLSGNPVAGNNMILNGETRTFQTTVTSFATEVAIGANAATTSTNLQNQLRTYKFSKIAVSRLGANVLLLTAELNQTITVSQTGAWATFALATNTVSQFPLNLPLSSEPDQTRATNAANDLVLALQNYATNFISTTNLFLTNYVNLDRAQTVTGKKTFTGATVLSNANQIFTGGVVSNVTGRLIHFNYATNYTGLTFDGFAVIAPDATGIPSIYETAGSPGYELGSAFNTTPTDASILNGVMGDYRYGKKAAANTWTAANTFTGGITNSIIGTTKTTNMQAGIDNAWITNIATYSTLKITNTAPAVSWNDSDGGVNEKRHELKLNGTTLSGIFWSDDGLSSSDWLRVLRTGVTPYEVYYPLGVVRAAQGLLSDASMWVTGNGAVSGIVGAGSTNFTVPSSMTKGVVLVDGSDLAGNPTTGLAIWTASGVPKYRTSGASEGSGANNFLHNRGAQTIGSGTDYNLTTSYAQVGFGSGMQVALPTAGTYYVFATVTIDADAGTGGDAISAKLYNSTTVLDVSGSEKTISNITAGKRDQLRLEVVITVTGGNTIQLYAKNQTSARGTVDSDQTTMTYIRLY